MRQSLISEYFLYNPSQLQKNHLRLLNRFLSQFPIDWESKSALYMFFTLVVLLRL